MAWALYKNGIQVSKKHPCEKCAEVEAFELCAIIRGRFNPGQGVQKVLIDDYEIKEVEDD